MLENPHITTAELMQSLQCSRATVARLIKELKEKGYLIREGSNKKGMEDRKKLKKMGLSSKM